MSLPNPKEIKKLAKACRDAGITHFRSADFEFTLGDLPEKRSKNATIGTKSDVQGAVDTNVPSQEELLWWSVQAVPGENTAAEQ